MKPKGGENVVLIYRTCCPLSLGLNAQNGQSDLKGSAFEEKSSLVLLRGYFDKEKWTTQKSLTKVGRR